MGSPSIIPVPSGAAYRHLRHQFRSMWSTTPQPLFRVHIFGILAGIEHQRNQRHQLRQDRSHGQAITAGIAIGTAGTATVNNLGDGITTALSGRMARTASPSRAGRHRHRQRGHDRGGIGAGITGGVAIKADGSRRHRRRHQCRRHSGEQHRDFDRRPAHREQFGDGLDHQRRIRGIKIQRRR